MERFGLPKPSVFSVFGPVESLGMTAGQGLVIAVMASKLAVSAAFRRSRGLANVRIQPGTVPP